MGSQKTLSEAQARDELERQGLSIAAWARLHGFPTSTVCRVLKGETPGRIGQGHRIKVLLGMKDGVVHEAR